MGENASKKFLQWETEEGRRKKMRQQGLESNGRTEKTEPGKRKAARR